MRKTFLKLFGRKKSEKEFADGIMIKFGKKNHLKQIVNGQIRFSPSQNYITIEETQHNHGQGDLLEGKWRIHAESLRVFHPETHEYLGAIEHKADFTVSIQDVNDMPVFCLSRYESSHVDDGMFQMEDNEYKKIIKDFPEATHALIILEPSKFVNGVNDSINHMMIADLVRYFDYRINDLRMAMYLTTGDENAKTQGFFYGTGTYENRYRHLLCKDVDFINQKEFRFIIQDELISTPKFYEIRFESKYILVPIKRLRKGVML